MAMTREEVAMMGFEIVAYAGDARGKLLSALKLAEQGDFETPKQLVEEAGELIRDAHKSQTSMLQSEAQGEEMEMSFIMIHGQDHLMTTILLKDVIETLLKLLERTANN